MIGSRPLTKEEMRRFHQKDGATCRMTGEASKRDFRR